MAEAALVRAASGTPAGCAKLDHQDMVAQAQARGKTNTRHGYACQSVGREREEGI